MMKPTDKKEPRSGCNLSEAKTESTVEAAPVNEDTPDCPAVEWVVTDTNEEADILRGLGRNVVSRTAGAEIPHSAKKVVFAVGIESAFDSETAEDICLTAKSIPAEVSVCTPVTSSGLGLQGAATALNGTFKGWVQGMIGSATSVKPGTNAAFLATEMALSALAVLPEDLRANHRKLVLALAGKLDMVEGERLIGKAAKLFGCSPAVLRRSGVQQSPQMRGLLNVAGINVRVVPGERVEIIEPQQNSDSVVCTPLAYFTAKLTEEITVHRVGGDVRKDYVVECEAATGKLPLVKVPSVDFGALGWVPAQLGSRAKLAPMSPAKREILRCAIEMSSKPTFSDVYQELGWRQIDGKDVYLHAGGGIGQDGVIEARVEPGDRLTQAVLPAPALDPTTVLDLIADLIGCCLPEVTWPLLAATFRAPLLRWQEQVDSIFVCGRSGSQKTSLVILFQQFFGAGFGGGRGQAKPPASFSDTAKSIIHRAHVAAHMLVVVDDYAPASNDHRAAQQQAVAEEVLRAAGNRSGRGRLTADAQQMASLAPRSLIIATGEDCQMTESIVARLFLLEIARGQVILPSLGISQERAWRGEFSALMADYIAWLAERGGPIGSPSYETAPTSGEIPRAPDMHANLAWGLKNLFAWLVARGAAADECGLMERAALAALKVAAEKSVKESTGVDPASRFIDTLCEALAEGSARIIGSNESPDYDSVGKGPVVGYHSGTGSNFGDRVWLLPSASLAAIKKLGAKAGKPYTLSERGTGKRLHESALLLATDTTRGTLTVRRTLGGQPHIACWEVSGEHFSDVGRWNIPF